jgi:GTPase
MFVDTIKIKAIAGKGGDGCISFRREKYVPRGGPDGGDGGNGGDVVLQASHDVDSLEKFHFKPILKADRGRHGQGKQKTGHQGEDRVVTVPVGTLVKDPYSGNVIYDLDAEGKRCTLADGGKGGRGNYHFKSNTNRAPRISEPGEEGPEIEYDLELKLIADVGLVGFPNAGKTTLLSKTCACRPKIASYPFTTLHPNLGVLQEYAYKRTIKIADVPGLIEGAHENRGLGHQFLRHIERTRVLLYVIDMAGADGREPLEDFQVLEQELTMHDQALAEKPFMVACNKMDLSDSQEKLDDFFKNSGIAKELIFPISCEDDAGLEELTGALVAALDKVMAAEKTESVDEQEPVDE